MTDRVAIDETCVISFFTAFLFLIHPFNVESVAWMSASKVLVYSFFYLCAIYTFLFFIERKKFRYYVLTLILYAFSFLGKEQAVTFPLLMLLVYWSLHVDILSKEVWLIVLPFFLLSIFFGVVTIMSQYSNGNMINYFDTYSFGQRIVYACYSLVEYFSKCLFPFKLSYLYPFLSSPTDSMPVWLLMYPLFLIVFLFTLWKYLAKWTIAFGLMFFLIHILLALHIVSLSRFAVVADRYIYIGSIGICFIIVYYLFQLYKYIKGMQRVYFILLVVSYLSYFGIYSNLRTRTWYNSDTLKHELRDLIKQRSDYKVSNHIFNDML